MINFRYHLISLVAVFLALSVGIVMGSTVIDRAIVDSLRSQINKAEKNSIERKVENDRLNETLKQLDEQSTVLGAHSVRGYLAGQTVYVMTIGDVKDDVRVETLELLATSNAKVGSVIRFKQDFLESDKANTLGKIKDLDNVESFLNGIDNKDEQLSMVIQEALAVQAGAPNEANIPADQIISLSSNSGVFEQQEKAASFNEVNPVSFIVLAQRTELENKKTQTFLARMQSKYPVSVGLVGRSTDLPSRSDSIEHFGSFIPKFAIVDNAETPNGRAALLIAHAANISGDRQVYGVSDKAKSPAPIYSGS